MSIVNGAVVLLLVTLAVVFVLDMIAASPDEGDHR